MASDSPGGDVVHIGENAEIVERSSRNISGLLTLDEPSEADVDPVHEDALRDAIGFMDDEFWRPTIVTAAVTDGDAETQRLLAFVHEDDPEEMIIVCPVMHPDDRQEATA